MAETKAIIATATVLYGKISRAYDNLRKLGEANITLGAVEARLQNLEKLWEKFDAINDTLADRVEEIKHDVYAKQDIPSLGEEAYLQNKGLMLDLKSALQRRLQAASSTSAAPTTSAPRTALPKIQPPTFAGKNQAARPVEKLHYLKLCVKGDAELLIRNLSTTDENYEIAWKTLSNFYENKRLLTRNYLNNFLALTKMKSESAAELGRLFHGVKTTVSSLKSIDRPIDRTEDLFVHLVVELLDNRSRREWESVISHTTNPPTYAELEGFIERRLHTLEALFPVKNDSRSSSDTKATRSHHVKKTEPKDRSRSRCAGCQGDHFIMFCSSYKEKTATARMQFVREQNLCSNCLGRHQLTECASKKTCMTCGSRHHSSLHDAFRDAETATTSHVAQGQPFASVTVLLATARVRVLDRHGSWHPARALIDQGSETTIVSERLVQRLRLPRTSAAVSVYGLGEQRTGIAKGKVKLTFRALNGETSNSVSALILPKLTLFSGGCRRSLQSWTHLRDLELADPEFHSADPVDLLLGADVYGLIIRQGLKKGGPQEPVAQQTSLGWILSGAINDNTRCQRMSSHHCQVEEDLTCLVRRFWEQEEVRQPSQLFTKVERECEEHYRQYHTRNADGRYVVRLPTTESLPDLSGTIRAARRALQHTEKKFDRESEFRGMYVKFMQQYLDLRHMMPAPPSTTTRPGACYLPHHGVLRPDSTSTKLRVVFNGSSSLPNGDSLNRYLATGPNLLPSLADILLSWRRHRYVFATDIEKMYRQILVHPDDQCLQRILWRESSNDEVKEYWLSTVTYGLSCAPYLAIRTLRQLAEDEGHRYPKGALILLSDVYMDDILAGAETMEEAEVMIQQLKEICRAGGFSLKKWSANHSLLLNQVEPDDRLRQESRWWLPGESHSTLGLRWQPRDDLFAFATKAITLSTFSKRSVLLLTAKMFDPLGWLAPTTILAKIFIQSTWLLGLDWDAPLPCDEARRWLRFQSELPALEKVIVPRWLGGVTESMLEIHGFADASERAYSAVIYLKSKTKGITKVTLLAAKTKVAPLKQVSLPRLELSAATLLARLVAHTLPIIGAERAPLHMWSDSTVTLGWIRGHPSTWATYVANRVSEIQTLIPDAHWHHVPGRENPADCASRGLYPGELVDHPLWWQGPEWLATESSPWINSGEEIPTEDLPERRVRAHAAAVAELEPESELLLRYSSLTRLLRITAWCRRWWLIHRQLRHPQSQSNEISADDLTEARLSWVRLIQAGKLKEEIRRLRHGTPLPSRSALLKLNPFLDSEGLLRVGGRLSNADLPYDATHPLILPSESTFTNLVIDDHHQRTLHGGTQLTLCSLRQEYWVPRGRSLVKRRISRCVRCIRWRAAIPQPLMGDLPEPRVKPSRPFLHTGIDYAGPVWMRTSKGRGHKASKGFIVVFICLASRAVHLDVASDYSADAFIAALRRLISRRGICISLYSDCGTNFVGADRQLGALFSAASADGRRIAAFAAQEKIRWHFNPPAAPNFGGLWEAAVKSMKHHLRRVIGDARLTYEEMATLLSQIEACLNSRPLQPLSDDPEDVAALTPGHFLIGSALSAVPEPSLEREPSARLSRWQLLQQMRDHFWSRWSSEYLHTLAHRPKWSRVNQEACIGRLCLIRSEHTPPTRWPLARVTRLHPGSDGHVRVVELRTANTNLTRPVSKLVFLTDGAEVSLESKLHVVSD
ncbi:uncharacterized protein LOC114928280 [Nylanderia fulva]|uniref:uncharacterized protein LOC114928280 n=1 Tax=Nylanderia fulva TaxID=613905 RepID=UPI0010FAFBC5|nr:uncharacterized protein LOC114928280 [Nylanderia fulva]